MDILLAIVENAPSLPKTFNFHENHKTVNTTKTSVSSEVMEGKIFFFKLLVINDFQDVHQIALKVP